MSKITSLHPRAEQLLLDAGVNIGGGAGDETVAAHAFICGAYMGMDAVSKFPRLTSDQQALTNRAIDELTGVATRLANAQFDRTLDLLDEATKIMRLVDAMKEARQ